MKKSQSSGRSCASKYTTTCQPSGAIRARDLEQHLARREIHEPPDEVEAGAAHAGGVHGLELGVGDVAADRGHAACPIVGMGERIDQRAVVVAVAGRLDDDVALEAEEVAQREQFLFRRVARRVLALLRIRKRGRRTEHMAVRVDRAFRRRANCGRDGDG